MVLISNFIVSVSHFRAGDIDGQVRRGLQTHVSVHISIPAVDALFPVDSLPVVLLSFLVVFFLLAHVLDSGSGLTSRATTCRTRAANCAPCATT